MWFITKYTYILDIRGGNGSKIILTPRKSDSEEKTETENEKPVNVSEDSEAKQNKTVEKEQTFTDPVVPDVELQESDTELNCDHDSDGDEEVLIYIVFYF